MESISSSVSPMRAGSARGIVALARIAVRFDQIPSRNEGPTLSGASSSVGRSFEPLTKATVREPAVKEPSITSTSRELSVWPRKMRCLADSSEVLTARKPAMASSSFSRRRFSTS